MIESGEEAGIAGATNAKRLPHHHHQLEKEYEEKDHKIETRIIAERFVGRTVPDGIE